MDYPIVDDHEATDYDAYPEHHTDVYTYQPPHFVPAPLVADPLDRITLAQLRAIWSALSEEERCAIAFDLLSDVVKPYHQRGMAWGIQATRLRNRGGVGPTPYQPKHAIKSEQVTVKLG
jgi:hypothetical protein